MLRPSIFGMDRFFDDFDNVWNFEPAFKNQTNVMKKISTDVKELADGYEIDMELPGFKKEEVTAELKDGYLTISAEHNDTKDEQDEDGHYIRKERYYGKCQRSFYVGEYVEQEDVKAKFENGILTLNVPKKETKPTVEEKKFIAIE